MGAKPDEHRLAAWSNLTGPRHGTKAKDQR